MEIKASILITAACGSPPAWNFTQTFASLDPGSWPAVYVTLNGCDPPGGITAPSRPSGTVHMQVDRAEAIATGAVPLFRMVPCVSCAEPGRTVPSWKPPGSITSGPL
jgi:hypothetical protein